MTDYTLPLTLLYVVLAFLLLCLCLFTPWRLWVKAGRHWKHVHFHRSLPS